MTKDSLADITFRCVSSMSLSHEHILTYESVDYIKPIRIFVYAPIKYEDMWGKIYGRRRTHYVFNSKVYKSKKKFLEAITAFEEERKSKFEKK